MNCLGPALDDLVDGIRNNDKIVALKLKNTSIDGRKNQEQLFSLLLDHPSLTCVDLSNSDCVHNRNRICDEGFYAIAEGINNSQHSLISELHLQSCFLTGASLAALSML